MASIRLKVDKNGIIIPRELLEKYGFKEDDLIEIEIEKNEIVLKLDKKQVDVRKYLKKHRENLAKLGIEGSKSGELKGSSMEMEFENDEQE
ncbi:MAG: hypothetical protein GF308_06675 [Candidatus Heimdallarchaeota archaeon]|nr:hypothetical protein [Candidatus Heimdallarchaeota archaeon]